MTDIQAIRSDLNKWTCKHPDAFVRHHAQILIQNLDELAKEPEPDSDDLHKFRRDVMGRVTMLGTLAQQSA